MGLPGQFSVTINKAKAQIAMQIAAYERQLSILRIHLTDGGHRIRNTQIIPRLEEQLSGAKDLLMALNDPAVPNGSAISRIDHNGAFDGTFTARVQKFRLDLMRLTEETEGLTNG